MERRSQWTSRDWRQPQVELGELVKGEEAAKTVVIVNICLVVIL